MNKDIYEKKFNEYLSLAENGIKEFFIPATEVEKAMEYTLSAGGKSSAKAKKRDNAGNKPFLHNTPF